MKSTETASRSALPSAPEVVTLQGKEWILYTAGRKSGQAEGLRESAGTIQKAVAHYRRHPVPKAAIELVETAMLPVATALVEEAKRLDREQNELIGRFILAQKAKRPGWLVRLWRALKQV